MNKIDVDGLTLANLQGKIFEESTKNTCVSSLVFIRRYMYSTYCKEMDDKVYLTRIISVNDGIESVNNEYNNISYGSKLLSNEKMFWIGYIYRYWAYVTNTSSSSIFKLINGKEMQQLYNNYHTLDPMNAIQRILESKNIDIFNSVDSMTIKGKEILKSLIEKTPV